MSVSELERQIIDEYYGIITVFKYLIPKYGEKGLVLNVKEVLETDTATKEQLERYLKYLSVYQIVQTIDTRTNNKDTIIVDVHPDVIGMYIHDSGYMDTFFSNDDYRRKLLCIRKIFKGVKIPHCAECCEYDD